MNKLILPVLVLVSACASAPPPADKGFPLPEPTVAAAPPPPAPAPPPPPAVAPDEPWRAAQPAGGQPADVKLPSLQRKTLPNGLELIVVENHTTPVVAFHLIVFAGGERNPKDLPGLAHITAGMLDEGTKTKDSIAIAESIESIGAMMGANADYDAASVSLTTLSQHVGRALDVFADVVLHPAFSEADFTRVRDQLATELLQSRDQPAAVASRTFQRVLYGDKHPYAFPSIGTEASLKKMTRKDLEKFYGQFYKPDQAKLVIVGDITLDEATRQVGQRLGEWKKGKVAKLKPLATPKDGARKVVLVDKEGASQSVVTVGHVSVARNNPDYVPMMLMNYILGGAFSSRININLREKKGYTYGARSGFSFRRGPGPFSAGGNMRGDVTRESLEEILKELGAIRQSKVTDEELAEAKSSIIGKTPARFESNAAIAGQIADLVIHNLPLDYYETLNKRIEAVTADDVLRVAKTYVRPDASTIVVVGDRKSVEPKVKELNLGAIEIRGTSGEPAKQ